MQTPRKVCVVSSSRADYGLMHGLLDGLNTDTDFKLQLIATGMHLEPAFGLTVRQIEADGFMIDARIDMQLRDDTARGVTKSIALGVAGFADAFKSLKPDILVLLGDRFEMLAAAQAALVARVPIAHIHGGEISEGAIDESIRHSISKMAQWHFVAAEPYRKRVIQLGEDPERVFNFGAPGLDALETLEWMDRAALEADAGLSLRAPVFLVTYHPTTLSAVTPAAAIQEVLAALAGFPDATIIFTYPNADTGGRVIIDEIQRFVAYHPERSKAFASLGQRRYLSLMRICDVVVGNSSSGLIEAPALKTATVNVGERQQGRLRASSVIDVDESRADIMRGIAQACTAEFQATLSATTSWYGQGRASSRIREALKTVPLGVRKHFFDIEHRF